MSRICCENCEHIFSYDDDGTGPVIHECRAMDKATGVLLDPAIHAAIAKAECEVVR